MKTTVARIRILDAGRGAAMIGMMVHHLLYDLQVFFNVKNLPLINEPYFQYLQLLFVAIFILTAGITTYASRSNIRRGLIVSGVALGLTVFSLIFMPKTPIIFGILHFFGLSILIYGVFEKLFKKMRPKIFAPLLLAAFAVYYYFTYMRPNRVDFPGLFILGFPSYSFSSADYYPLLPWFFLFLLGTLLAKPVFEGRMPGWFYRFRCAPLEFMGKNTLIVFIAHQPVFMGVLWLLFDVIKIGG